MAKKSKKKVETVNEFDIPEVGEYLEELAILEEFKQSHATIFETYSMLTEKVNQLLDTAGKIVRAQGVNCGPWHVLSSATKYDKERLRELIGSAKFDAIGGTSKTVYEIDNDKIASAIKSGAIAADVADEITDESLRYSAPKEIA